MDLGFADTSELSASGISFTCATCPKKIQDKRRCWEDRWDFTDKDDPYVFPMYVVRGGETYGFCPGKTTRDASLNALFRILLIAADTGAMLNSGGISDQPDWFVDLLAWFLPRLDMVRFTAKASMVLPRKDARSEHADFIKGLASGSNNRLVAR